MIAKWTCEPYLLHTHIIRNATRAGASEALMAWMA